MSCNPLAERQRHEEDARGYLIRAAEATMWDGGSSRLDDRHACALTWTLLALLHLVRADPEERALGIVSGVLADVAEYKRGQQA